MEASRECAEDGEGLCGDATFNPVTRWRVAMEVGVLELFPLKTCRTWLTVHRVNIVLESSRKIAPHIMNVGRSLKFTYRWAVRTLVSVSGDMLRQTRAVEVRKFMKSHNTTGQGAQWVL
jgi:hypothetical protein